MACSIEVPAAWFEVGATLQVLLPRLLNCARCDGGGCDACERRGAFDQQAAGIAAEVALVLPLQPPERSAPVRLRLPALGARAAQPELPAGHLLLTVLPHPPEPGWAPSSAVRALDLPRQRSRWRISKKWLRPPRVWIWAALVPLITLLCFWLLHRSS